MLHALLRSMVKGTPRADGNRPVESQWTAAAIRCWRRTGAAVCREPHLPVRMLRRLGCCLAILLVSPSLRAQQQTLILDNGFAIGPGSLSVRAGLDVRGSAGSNEAPAATRINVIDDGLRLTFVSSKRSDRPVVETPAPFKIQLRANRDEVCKSDSEIAGGLGSAYSATPFNPFGRRIYMFQVPNKQIVQGITEISPQYVRIQGLKGQTPQTSITWDMRVAMSSIPPRQLQEILTRNADKNQAQDWLDIVSVYMGARRFIEAREMLVRAINRFPELQANGRIELKRLDQLLADQMFDAVLVAQNAGQHTLAEQMLRSFNATTVSIETKLKIDRKLEGITSNAKECDQMIAWLREDIGNIVDANTRKDLLPVVDEIAKYLNSDTRERFADYVRLRSDATLTPDQRAAMGLSGWLYGAGLAEQNLSIVRSGYIARELIQKYLAAQRRNDQTINEITKLESGTPRYIAKILENMAPPLATEAALVQKATVKPSSDATETIEQPIPGRYLLEVPLGGPMRGRTVRYSVQLPAEYNPFRRYPCVLALGSEEIPFNDALEWWVSLDRSQPQLKCYGEAARHGCIVVAPEWNEAKQPMYNYTENEHAMILAPLRDAMRRFSIDSDRVFVAGHFMGADAAWDLALAHPDLWAGAIIIGGISKKFVVQYWPNSRYVPTYFVNGQFDGENPMYLNAQTWDNMLDDKNIDTMVTLYQGRGHDHFQEELPRIMEWMEIPSRRRNFNPDKFKVVTSRAGDRFFWWFETENLFTEKLVNPLFEPEKWDEYEIDGSINKESNAVRLNKVAAKAFTIWLNPDMVDFTKRVSIETKGTTKKIEVAGSTGVILEDVRLRGDRQHPFWYRVDLPFR
jgi:predicted esterase